MERQRLIHALASTIAAIERPHPVRVAIDGVDAAGKTTLADELAAAISGMGRQVLRVSIDGFHNPKAVRYRRGRESPEGYFEDSFNYSAFIEVLRQPIGPGAIVIVDGVFLLRDELRRYFDYSVFLRVGFDVSIARAEKRDVDVLGCAEAVRDMYRKRYIPGQQLYFARVDPERRASVVIDNNDPERPVVITQGLTWPSSPHFAAGT